MFAGEADGIPPVVYGGKSRQFVRCPLASFDLLEKPPPFLIREMAVAVPLQSKLLN